MKINQNHFWGREKKKTYFRNKSAVIKGWKGLFLMNGKRSAYCSPEKILSNTCMDVTMEHLRQFC